MSVLLDSYYIDRALVHAGQLHRRGMCLPTPTWDGLSDTSSPISNRDVAGAEAAHLEARTIEALACSKRQVTRKSEWVKKKSVTVL